MTRETVTQIEDQTSGGYSFDRYSRAGWRACIRALLAMGCSERLTVDIMLSKMPRWAADRDETRRWGRHNGRTWTDLLSGMRLNTPADIARYLGVPS